MSGQGLVNKVGASPLTHGNLVGCWLLHSWVIERPGKAPATPFGPSPTGMLLYTPDGYMSAQLGHPERPTLAGRPMRGLPPELNQALVEQFFAYCGRFWVEESQVVHEVTWSFNPDFVGQQQVREARLQGYTLTLTGYEQDSQGQQRTHQLHWYRPGSQTG